MIDRKMFRNSLASFGALFYLCSVKQETTNKDKYNSQQRTETMEQKKYRLLETDTIKVGGRTLYRIEAIQNFGDVKTGDKGGYIESEANLSHEGDCWVYGDAQVYGDTRISDNAWVCGRNLVFSAAEELGKVKGRGKARDRVKAQVSQVYRRIEVYGSGEGLDEAGTYFRNRLRNAGML